jgi:hypothetical protein
MRIPIKFFAILILLLCVLVSWSILREDNSADSHPSYNPFNSDYNRAGVTIESDTIKRERPMRVPVQQFRPKRELVISEVDPKVIDWTLDELDYFLTLQSRTLDKDEMKSLVSYILPDPQGSDPVLNRMQPGSISASDQAAISLKHTDPEHHQGMLQNLWSKHRYSSDADFFLGEVAKHLEPGPLRQSFITHVISGYYSDFDRFFETIRMIDNPNNVFPNFNPIKTDSEAIFKGLEVAAVKSIGGDEMRKEKLIDEISRSDIQSESKNKLIDYIQAWAR